jgi:hypothetical protein
MKEMSENIPNYYQIYFTRCVWQGHTDTRLLCTYDSYILTYLLISL